MRSAGAALTTILFLAAAGAAQNKDTVAAPVFTPPGSSGFIGSVQVTIDLGANDKIFYTENGSDPASDTVKPAQYTGGNIPIKQTTTLRAVRIEHGQKSPTAVGFYTQMRLPKPVANYGGSLQFAEAVLCTLTVAAPGAKQDIHFTLDGSAPSGNSPAYTGPIAINATETLQAVAVRADYAASPVLSVPFVKLGKVAKPTATPSGGTFSNQSQPVVLKSSTPGARFRYTFNPKAPASAWLATKDTVQMIGTQINQAIVLTAVAVENNMFPSDTLTARYTYLPRVAMPKPSLAEGFFYDTARVSFTSDPGASFRCAFGESSIPDENSPACDSAVFLDSTVTLKAIAVKPPQPPSEAFSGKYILRLSKPTTDLAGSEFKDSIVVHLYSPSPKAIIRYTLDGTYPGRGQLYSAKDGVPITQDSTFLRAVAIRGADTSLVAAFDYHRNDTLGTIPGPSFNPLGREFVDSQRVTLKTLDPLAKIYYTFDDTVPDVKNGHEYTGPIFIFRTTRINAVAYRTGMPPSKPAFEDYTLIPSPPTADPPAGSYPNRVDVKLATRTKDCDIRFWYGKGPYDPQFAKVYGPALHPLLLASDRLQAVTVTRTDHKVSAVFYADYTVYPLPQSDTLKPGESLSVEGGYTFTNASGTPVNAQVTSTDGAGIDGFQNLGLGVLLSGPSPFPRVTYSRKPGLTESLYRLNADNSVEFVTADAAAEIAKPGLYFPGVDVQPPVVKVAGQEVHFGDSTLIRLSIEDNVAGPLCRVESPGIAGGLILPAPGADGYYSFKIKSGTSDPKPLWFRARASDNTNVTWFPGDSSAAFFVSQAWQKVVSSADWKTGASREHPWDLIGVPYDSAATPTLKTLKLNNPGVPLAAAVYNGVDYDVLKDDDRLPAGGLWLGSTRPVSSLTFTNLLSPASAADGAFHVRLHPGWNVIANPSWERMYWPISRREPRYSSRFVKSLFGAVAETGSFAPSDSLDLWKGYFVFNFRTEDTVVSLLRAPPVVPLARAAAPKGSYLELSFGMGRALPLLLGAQPFAHDDIAVEDEPQLPSWQGGEQLWSQRGTRRLMTDLLHFDPQGVYHWTLISDRSGSRAAGGAEALRLLADNLPSGFEAWAVSPGRRLKTRLSQGLELPSGDAGGPDTLSIYAGPAAKLAGLEELKRSVEHVSEADWSAIPGRNGLVLKVTVPQGCRLRAELWSPAGARLSEFDTGELGAGLHSFNLGTAGRTGLALLRLRVSGGETEAVFTRKIIFR